MHISSSYPSSLFIIIRWWANKIDDEWHIIIISIQVSNGWSSSSVGYYLFVSVNVFKSWLFVSNQQKDDNEDSFWTVKMIHHKMKRWRWRDEERDSKILNNLLIIHQIHFAFFRPHKIALFSSSSSSSSHFGYHFANFVMFSFSSSFAIAKRKTFLFIIPNSCTHFIGKEKKKENDDWNCSKLSCLVFTWKWKRRECFIKK